MEKFAGGVACEADRARCSKAKKASGGKACQLRKTLTAEPGTARRPERRVGARLSRAQDAFDCVAIPRHSWSADGQRNCILYIAAKVENSLFCRHEGTLHWSRRSRLSAAIHETALQPPEIVRLDAPHTPLTRFNADRLARIEAPAPIHFRFTASSRAYCKPTLIFLTARFAELNLCFKCTG